MTFGLAVTIYFTVGVVCVLIASRLPALFGPITELFFAFDSDHPFLLLVVIVVWIGWPITLTNGMLLQHMSLKPHLLKRKDDEIDKTPFSGVSKRGVCVTDLRPIGKINFEGKTYPATCLNQFIESGTVVTVVNQRGNELVVELPSDSEPDNMDCEEFRIDMQ